MTTSSTNQKGSNSQKVTKDDVERLLVLGELLRSALTKTELEQLHKLLAKEGQGKDSNSPGQELSKLAIGNTGVS